MTKVLVTHYLPAQGLEELKQKFTVAIPDKGMIDHVLYGQWIEECEALLPTYAFKVTKEVMQRAKRLRIVANFGAGFDNVDVEYATSRGILVTNSPDPVIEPTAELAFALMLSVARRVTECDRKMRSKEGIYMNVMCNLGVGLYGKILGIVGMGSIGQALARRACACGMKIVYHNRRVADKSVEEMYGARWVSLDELLAVSDFVSLHAPATPETYHLIDAPQLERMKPDAILINTARGTLVNEQALVRALGQRLIFGAGLDVFEHEPKVSPELLSLDNVVLSPHNGTGTIDARIASTRYAAQNIIRFFERKEVLSSVNKING